MECLTLKKSNCKNCYKCIRNCPVKSIRFSGNQAYIIENECVLCGHCFVVCPQDAKQIVDETEKVKVLMQMGKTKPEDELNCGSCGYNTCREKAIAILQGKAEISMCLPFLKEKAENISDTIARNSPNGLIVLNEKLEVQQVNLTARRILNLRSAEDILGDQVVRVMEPADFEQVLSTGRPLRDKREYLAEYGRYVEKTIVYDKDYKTLLGILRDVTDEEMQREKKEDISRQTVETMMAEGIRLEECVSTIAETLPICSVRGVAYSTFTIIHLIENQRLELIQYDNPAHGNDRRGGSAHQFQHQNESGGGTVGLS